VYFDEAIPRKSALWVLPPEGATMRVEPSPRDEDGELKAVVRPGRIVRGTVRDGAGGPVSGATVTLRVEAESRELAVRLRTSTDAAGAYAFPRVASGALRVTAEGNSDYTESRCEEARREDLLVVDLRLGGPRD
jgi:protocatechuate 3,4-dioxygenase beta subunit